MVQEKILLTLVQKNFTARVNGGPARIRRLPLEEKLQLCTRIADELGRKKAADAATLKLERVRAEKTRRFDEARAAIMQEGKAMPPVATCGELVDAAKGIVAVLAPLLPDKKGRIMANVMESIENGAPKLENLALGYCGAQAERLERFKGNMQRFIADPGNMDALKAAFAEIATAQTAKTEATLTQKEAKDAAVQEALAQKTDTGRYIAYLKRIAKR